MSLRTRYFGGFLHWYDSVTDETVRAVCPVWERDDFTGKALDTVTRWTALDTSAAGNTTPTPVANAPNGALNLPLDATNEVQLSGIYWGDSRILTLNQKLIVEARINFPVLPTGAVIACFGLCGNHNAAVDTVAESIWFRWDGSGATTVETDDTVNETTKVATTQTLVAAQKTVLRIEIDNTAAVRFYADGTRLASATTFNMSTAADLPLQPVLRIGKEGAATTVGTLQVDYVEWGQQRTS